MDSVETYIQLVKQLLHDYKSKSLNINYYRNNLLEQLRNETQSNYPSSRRRRLPAV